MRPTPSSNDHYRSEPAVTCIYRTRTAGSTIFKNYFATATASSSFTESNFDTPSLPIVTP